MPMGSLPALLIKHLLFSPVHYDPAQEIVYKGDRRVSYAEFRQRVARLAAMLKAQGIGPGDTVAVMDYDSHRYLECYFAVPMIGAVLHTINVRLSSEQLVYTISHAEDDLILVHDEFIPLLAPIRGRIESVQKFIRLTDEASDEVVGCIDPAGLNFVGEYEQLLQAAEPLETFPDLDENTRATCFYTTGTTGLPKGVYFSHRQLVLHTLATLMTLASNSTQGRFHRADVYMPITPMFHVHAWGIPYMATLLGVKQVYPGKYIPHQLARLIETEGVTFSHCVPTILHMLLNDPKNRDCDLSRWKVLIGGSSLPKALCRQALSRGVDIYTGYGMSETCPILTLSQLSDDELALPMDEQIDRRVRTGRPLPLVALRVVDAEGGEVANDDHAPGEVQVRAPWLTQGYLKDEKQSERLWAGGWLHTHDVACREPGGSIRITDRTKDVIKVGGEWLSSLELEDVLMQHPDVSEVAVIGQPAARWGEIPLALVVPRTGSEPDERELTRHVREFVDKGMLPKESILLKVRLVDQVDKTSVGKTNKVALREKYLT
ncbi:long-chain fatty acid--CoA ligase [Ectothiorhodospira shaposhnikovii]|uniref:fatty acid--CoA ligase n=1 Tax=Ectothiorhodospira shaposhnikovii TaxID=1054 RepID=UPI001905E41C|nr:fatty acid--CoA ligase [Ectothiorhodospira shaposhnikovii]MBK1672428.1 long-chain fatty acid--CoA ligase [Ectothiorhodospira shaposhnikovii]